MHVLFDVNGTLLDPGGLTAAWEGAPRGVGLRVLDDAVAQSMVDTMTGVFRPFAEYLRSALAARAAVLGLGEDAVRAGVEAAAALPAYPDAADALARLKLAGATLAAVTNSAADAARSALRDAGLLDCFHAVVGADAVGAYKPDPRVYRRALDDLAVPARETWFVAGHWWDVAGAAYAGLKTAWASRTDLAYPAAMPQPDVRGKDIAEVAEAILRSA